MTILLMQCTVIEVKLARSLELGRFNYFYNEMENCLDAANNATRRMAVFAPNAAPCARVSGTICHRMVSAFVHSCK